MSTTLGCKDVEIKKPEFVAMNQSIHEIDDNL